jgi:hypothetical protein
MYISLLPTAHIFANTQTYYEIFSETYKLLLKWSATISVLLFWYIWNLISNSALIPRVKLISWSRDSQLVQCLTTGSADAVPTCLFFTATKPTLRPIGPGALSGRQGAALAPGHEGWWCSPHSPMYLLGLCLANTSRSQRLWIVTMTNKATTFGTRVDTCVKCKRVIMSSEPRCAIGYEFTSLAGYRNIFPAFLQVTFCVRTGRLSSCHARTQCTSENISQCLRCLRITSTRCILRALRTGRTRQSAQWV